MEQAMCGRCTPAPRLPDEFNDRVYEVRPPRKLVLTGLSIGTVRRLGS